MLSTLSEKQLHMARWCIFLAWSLLIVSLFYDPLSAALTHPESGSWMADSTIAIATDPTRCIHAQGYCVPLSPYSISTRVFWGMVIPSSIFIVLVFGHEFWRRLCPLYFFSQLPKALSIGPLLKLEQNQWLLKNHLYVQFGLFFVGITARIWLINSVRMAAGIFFIVTLLSAAVVVALYGGRSWCHYFCPFGMVQTVFTGPRGLLDGQAHTAAPYSITQSMCRTLVDGQVQSDCVACKSPCMDIDSERAYWEQLYMPGRRLVQYGYLGLVIGYFAYYILYAGNFGYYFSGVWSHEARTVRALLDPGFYLFGQAIALPKIIAAPLTLAAFAAASCWLCTRLERCYRGYLKQQHCQQSFQQSSQQLLNSETIAETSLHRMFSLCSFFAFNCFFIYGGRPEISRWPLIAQFGFQAVIAIVSSLWLYRTWERSREQYQKESLAGKLRHQLKKLPINLSELLGSSSLEQLSAEELTLLAQILPPLISPPTVQAEAALPKTVIKRSGLAIPLEGFAIAPSKTTLPKTQLPKTQIRKP
jgi:hypothetical protein